MYYSTKQIFYTSVLVVLLLMVVETSFSQDTESKDAVIMVTIYTKVKVEGMGCTACFDSLAERFGRQPNVKNVRKYYEKASITFSMPSIHAIDRERIKEMVHEVGLWVLDLEFTKVPIEVDPDVDKVF